MCSGSIQQADGGALITEGDGSGAYFASCGYLCWTSPEGSFTRLTFDGTYYTRAYPGSLKVRFFDDGSMHDAISRFRIRTEYFYNLATGLLVAINQTTSARE